nr:tetratricopeptide repeat-containing diguanylate cyclase [uncultured Undibacterium sp.]
MRCSFNLANDLAICLKDKELNASSDEKYYSLLQMIVIVTLLFVGNVAQADTDLPADIARLDAIQVVADKNNDEGIRQLIEFKNNLPLNVDPKVRLETLSILSGLYYDAGKGGLVKETINEFNALAKKMRDEDALLLIEIFDSFDVFDKSGAADAFVHLEKLRSRVVKSTSVGIQLRYHRTLASLYSITNKFDEALKQYLDMLKLSERLTKRQVQARMGIWSAISNLYLQMKDPKKALDATTEALTGSSATIAPKAFIEICISRGMALSMLKRNDDALKEYETALRIGREENLPYTVASALINIADQYLIKKDFKRAEMYARDAMAKSEAIEDEWSVAGAKVNAGLALGGQGKIAQGADLVNQSLEYFRRIHAISDVEVILGEFSLMYENAGMYKEALTLVREQQKLSDEIFRSDRAKAVAVLQEQFDAEHRKKQIEILAKDNALKDADIQNHRLQQVVALLASLVALLAGAFIYMLYRRSKKLNEQLQEVNLQLEFHAVRDPLTGLHNRRSFISLMAVRPGRVDVERREGYVSPDCMILLDIDHFKHINDTWGHAVGDVVLKEVATRLRSVVRDEDMLMRWGGEEFLIFSPKSNPEQITSLVQRVLCTIGETPFCSGTLSMPVTVTAGFISVPFSDVPEDVCDWERALQIADMALYLGKTHGRNRAYGLSRLLVGHEEAIPTLTHDLAAAIKQNMVDVIEVLGPVQEPSV